MRTSAAVLGLVLTMTIGIAGQRPALADQYRGTFEQRMACMPDVWRFCSDDIPDTNQIVACLEQNRAQLSDGCRQVFESNNRAQPPSASPPPSQAPSPDDESRFF
ncbi:MAG: cysteine rich repeat-containing protein [Bradyrhizobium sp.]